MTSEVKFQIFTCLHCSGCVQVLEGELKCHIFRHGTFKDSGKQMDPHAVKAECDRLAAADLIYGCGKPFRVIYDVENLPVAVSCD